MSLESLSRLRRSIGFRLALWSSFIFMAGFLILFVFAYLFLSSAIQQYEREGIQNETKECATQYEKGGIAGLKEEVEFEKRILGKNVFFVRLVTPGNETAFLNVPDQWKGIRFKELEAKYLSIEKDWHHIEIGDDVLEIASRRLFDGSLLQVGRSIERRGALLRRFHVTFAGILTPVILISFAGGIFISFRALRPIRSLKDTLQGIAATGKIGARVPERQTGDDFDELITVFNGMLERIRLLIHGMQSSLDNVAHDLRTPMTRLRGVAETALRSEQKAEPLQEAVITCMEESDRILTMLDTLLDISEAETGVMKLDLEEVKVRDLMDEVAELYAYVAEEKGISILTTCPRELSVKVDATRMRRVLANLLDNAIKYTEKGELVQLDAYQTQKEVVMLVRDNGVGIPPDQLSNIWDRLYRGDQSRSKRGLGLGLSLVKAIVKAHGGYVDVRSDPGSGSIFSLHFPARDLP